MMQWLLGGISAAVALILLLLIWIPTFPSSQIDNHYQYSVIANNSTSSNSSLKAENPFIYQLATERTKAYLKPDKYGPTSDYTLQLEPVLMWYNKGTSTSGENWTDYIFAYVRQTPLNGKGDVEAIIEFWDARNVTSKNSIQIEANRQAGNSVYMIIDGNRIDIPGYTSGFYKEDGTVTIYSQGQKTQFNTTPLPR